MDKMKTLNQTAGDPYVVRISLGSTLVLVFGAMAASYSLGQWSRSSFEEMIPMRPRLPSPSLPQGKSKPDAVYSGRHFDTGVPSRKFDVLLDHDKQRLAHEADIEVNGSVQVNEDDDDDDGDGEQVERVYEPAGQHLLVDIKNVNQEFLDSEEMLAKAMVSLVDQSQLTLLSYHCHGLEPMGISCVGVLLESHVSFHTWPQEGVITLDLFTCGPKPLIPLISAIVETFAIPREGKKEEVVPPRVKWAHKKRGFAKLINPESCDLENFFLGWMEYDIKKHVATVQTDLQKVEIFEFLDSRFMRIEDYEQSLSNDGSYFAQHSELFEPDKVVFLDEVLQSRLKGIEAYHEALVHPGLFAHPNPRRVAIIGGGEGATLREVLKHNTVEKCVMIEIDAKMVAASREHLPQWNNCSDIVGSADCCFDDDRAEIRLEDAVEWFIDNFSGKEEDFDESEKFDVIIIDALDPSSVVEFSDVIYGSLDFLTAIRNSLNQNGVLISQIGIDDEAAPVGDNFDPTDVPIISMMSLLEGLGFEKAKHYAEMHGGFMAPWAFRVAFRSLVPVQRWYANQAEIDLALEARAMPTKSGKSPFSFFDGATMHSYQYPMRTTEDSYCLSEPQPENCKLGRGFDPERKNAQNEAFEVRKSSIPSAGRGMFFKEAFVKGTYLAIDEGVHSMLFMPSTYSTISKFVDSSVSDLWNVMKLYTIGYGFATYFYGGNCYIVDSGIRTFINHGCNGTYQTGEVLSATELTADPEGMPENLDVNPFGSAFFDPFADRNHLVHLAVGETLRIDVEKGAEVTNLTEDRVCRLPCAKCESQSLGAVSHSQDETSKQE